MDETGQAGDTGAAEGGTGADARDRTLLNGWATAEDTWSGAGAALDPVSDIPAWRRPPTEIRPLSRDPVPRDPVPRDPLAPDPLSPDPLARDRFARDRPARTPLNGEPAAYGQVNGGSQARGHPLNGDFLTDDRAGADRRYPDGRGDVRPFGRDRPNGDIRPGTGLPSTEAAPTEEFPPRRNGTTPRWSDSRSRYADLLAHLSPAPNGSSSTVAPAAAEPPRSADDIHTAELGSAAGPERSFPASAPPYPYEGDLDDAVGRNLIRPPVAGQRGGGSAQRPPAADRATFPAVRPSTPGARPVDRGAESARHALDHDTPSDGLPRVGQPRPGPSPAGQPGYRSGQLEPDGVRSGSAPSGPSVAGEQQTTELGSSRQSYDPAAFPRRLPYEAPRPRPTSYESAATESAGGYVPPAAYASYPPRSSDEAERGRAAERQRLPRALPRRVPAQPDVPTVPEPPSVEPAAETPALARIATHLRRGDVLASPEREDGFDVQEILAAVREVVGVRDASLRTTPAGAHSLRLELSDGADPAEVSRRVARLLQDRMGLDAAMTAPDSPFAAPRSGREGTPLAGSAPTTGPYLPHQQVATGRAPVSGAGAGGLTGSGPTGSGLTGSGPTGSGPTGSVATDEQLPRAAPLESTPPVSFDEPPSRPAASEMSPKDHPSSATGHHVAVAEHVSADVEPALSRPLIPGDQPGPRVVIENVQVNTFGIEATVEVRLTVGTRTASGVASGPAVDGYLLRLCALATAGAIDNLLAYSDHVDGPARCYVEHAAAVPFGVTQVAVVVVLLSCGGWVEQLAGSSVVVGDDRHAMVRATLAAVNRRLEALLS